MTKRPSISLVNDSQAERRLAQQLNELFETYGLERYFYTETVQIEDGVIPHSHPILTLSPSTFGTQYLDNPNALLATYIHEQMHWFTLLETHKDNGSKAKHHFEKLYPDLPLDLPKGCGSRFSNYLHITVNWLEYDSLRTLLGAEKAYTELTGRNFYTSIYALVLENDADIKETLRQHNLLLPERPPEPKKFRQVKSS